MRRKKSWSIKSLIFASIMVLLAIGVTIALQNVDSTETRSQAAFNPLTQCRSVCNELENEKTKSQCKQTMCPLLISGQVGCGTICDNVSSERRSACLARCNQVSKCGKMCRATGDFNSQCLNHCRAVETNQKTCAQVCPSFPQALRSKCSSTCTSVFEN